MPDLDQYFDEIDAARIRRVRELSEIKRKFSSDRVPDLAGVNSKATVVLTYANWEGFYNDCARTYIRFLRERGGKIRDTDWMLLLGAFHADFESLRARSHSYDARRQFVADLQVRLECGFESFDDTIVEARSNLDFERLSQNFVVLNIDFSSMQRFRIRLDKEVVGWRHSVAHGDPPDLSALDISDHVDFTANLLIVLADRFQDAMLERI
jgi:hypothetical protein